MKNNKTIKEIHIERVNTLINFIQQKAVDQKISLKRKEVAEIVGVSEGDSLKWIFRILNEYPELYSDKITYEKKGKENIFGIAENNILLNNLRIVQFNKAIKLGDKKKFISGISAKKLNDLWTEQTITYNPNIQRGSKITKDKEGNEVETAVCSEKNIKEIAMRILKNDYCTDTIILNASDCNIEFIDDKLTITKNNKNSEINILDGQHRIKAIRLAYEIADEQNIDFDFDKVIFPIQIETLKVANAQSAFSQFTKGLKISTTRSEYFNNADSVNSFLKDVISNCNYKDKVEIVKDSIKGTDKLVSFGTLVTAFKENFKEEDLNEELKEYLISYFNLLENIISSNQEDKNDTMLKENIMYYGYLTLVKSMYSKNISLDLDTLKSILNKVDFSKKSSIWVGTVLLQGKRGLNITNKKDTRKYISNVFSLLV